MILEKIIPDQTNVIPNVVRNLVQPVTDPETSSG
jgi:hypothetical protein